jgi:hypothetical protein
MLCHGHAIALRCPSLFNLSADQGDADRQLRSGAMLVHGKGSEMDKTLARSCLKLPEDPPHLRSASTFRDFESDKTASVQQCGPVFVYFPVRLVNLTSQDLDVFSNNRRRPIVLL